MTFFSTLFNIKKSLMLANPVFNETHLQSPDFAEDDIDTEKWEYKVYQIYISLPDNFLHFSCQKKEMTYDRAEKNWCTFVPCTNGAPNINWRGTNYHAPTLFFMVINIFYSFITSFCPQTNLRLLVLIYEQWLLPDRSKYGIVALAHRDWLHIAHLNEVSKHRRLLRRRLPTLLFF